MVLARFVFNKVMLPMAQYPWNGIALPCNGAENSTKQAHGFACELACPVVFEFKWLVCPITVINTDWQNTAGKAISNPNISQLNWCKFFWLAGLGIGSLRWNIKASLIWGCIIKRYKKMSFDYKYIFLRPRTRKYLIDSTYYGCSALCFQQKAVVLFYS